MGLHVIVGAGPIGTATAEQLLAWGHEVRVVTRTGSGPDGTIRIAADASDTGRLTALAEGADALYNCANPPYHRWAELWPPLSAAFLAAAENTGAALVIMGNLYGYAAGRSPLTEETPLDPVADKGRIRADMWRAALAAHRAGRVRATEARASDFLGPGAASLFTTRMFPAVRAGKTALVPADPDLPHSVTFTRDAGTTLATLGTDPRSFGQAWHVPSPPPITPRELATRYARLVGAPAPRLRRLPEWALRLAGLLDAQARSFAEIRYQFEQPWILDSSRTEQTFALKPSTIDEALAATV